MENQTDTTAAESAPGLGSEHLENAPAFPCKITDHEALCEHQFPGMSLRDYFAAKAMEGDWAAQSNDLGVFTDTVKHANLEIAARNYYRMADAMMRVRAQNPAVGAGGAEAVRWFLDAESGQAKSKLTIELIERCELQEREYPFQTNPLNCKNRQEYEIHLQAMYGDVAEAIIRDTGGVAVVHKALIVPDDTDPDGGAKSIRVWMWLPKKEVGA